MGKNDVSVNMHRETNFRFNCIKINRQKIRSKVLATNFFTIARQVTAMQIGNATYKMR